MPTITANDLIREEFEEWAKTKSEWFAYNLDDPAEMRLMFKRDGEGYEDANVHSAWLGFQAAIL